MRLSLQPMIWQLSRSRLPYRRNVCCKFFVNNSALLFYLPALQTDFIASLFLFVTIRRRCFTAMTDKSFLFIVFLLGHR